MSLSLQSKYSTKLANLGAIASPTSQARPGQRQQQRQAQQQRRQPEQTRIQHQAGRRYTYDDDEPGHGYPQEGATRGSAIERAREAGLHQKHAQVWNATPGDEFFEEWHNPEFHDSNGEFNPGAYNGTEFRDGRDRPARSAQNRQFNRQGQLNAYDKREALQSSQSLLSSAARKFQAAKKQRQAMRQMTAAKRQKLAAAMQTDAGFKMIGQSLALPIKTILDYSGWSRKLLRERILEPSELFRIPLDVRANAMVLSQDGQGKESRAYVRWVTPGEKMIASFPSVAIEDLYEAAYDLLDRMQSTARQEIELSEDKITMGLVDTSATKVNEAVAFGALGIGAFEDIRYQVERHRLIVETFLINRQELSDVIKNMSAQVDPVTERELILAGFIGSILNCSVITSSGLGVEEVIPRGTVYALTGPDTLGEFGIRIELTAEPWNGLNQQKFVKGLAFCEKIAPIIVNARSCAKGVKTA